MNKKFGFYSYDVGPGNNMELLAAEAKKRGHEVVNPTKQMPVSEEAMVALVGCDVVVTGLSSFETWKELEVVRQLPDKVKWVVLEDVPDSCLRPKAHDFAYRTDLLLMAPHTNLEDVARFGYRHSIALGPPPLWDKEYHELMRAKAMHLRKGMEKTASIGKAFLPLQSTDNLVGMVAGKEPNINNLVLAMLIHALENKFRYVIGFSQHPGEKAIRKEGQSDEDFQCEVEGFERAFKARADMLKQCWHLAKNWKGVEIGATADVMVYAGGTHASIAGAYASVPGVYLDIPEVRERMVKQTGKETWFVAELGGCYKASDVDSLAATIKLASSDEGKAYLLAMQEAAFPIPDDWNTASKIIDHIEQF